MLFSEKKYGKHEDEKQQATSREREGENVFV
jgi:hypothetical protein